MSDDSAHWTLDKRIPLALILTLALQTAGFAFYMGQLSTRLDQAERVLDRTAGSGDRLTRLEVQLSGIYDAISRLERKIDGRQP